MTSNCNVKDFASDSQNFILRLSDDSINENTCDLARDYRKEKETDVIVISDSSSCCSSEYSEGLNAKSVLRFQKNTKYQRLYISQTSSENEVGRVDLSWRVNLRSDTASLEKPDASVNNVRNQQVSYSSDQFTTSSSSSRNYDGNANDQIKFDIERFPVSSTLTNAERRIRSPNTNKEYKIGTVTRSGGSSIVNRLNQCIVRNTPQKDRLTKNDGVRKIFKDTKSTRVVYDYPKEKKEINIIINESSDTDEINSISSKNRVHCNNDFPDVKANLKNDIIPDSHTNSPESCKIHASKAVDTPQDEEFYKPLSEKKKQQITEWLLTNRPDSLSDSSCSVIPASVRNSIDSGNDSLERLELYYETPNNRKKFDEVHTNEQTTVIANRDREVHLILPHQVTSNRVVQKSKNNSENRTSEKSKNSPKEHANKKISSSSKAYDKSTTTEDPKDLKDCANILDALYGKSWRDKANMILPTSEPRKKTAKTIVRSIQTERKPRLTDKNYATDSDEYDSDKNNVKSNSKKKIQRKYKEQDSFINDELISSDDESVYHTALTDLRFSTKGMAGKSWHHKPMPPSSTTTRILNLCDTDIEDESDKSSKISKKKGLQRRRLSFSDNDSSKTSEFDPGDFVPPKLIHKKNITKTQQTPKTIKSQSIITNRFAKHKSFLTSLSSTIQIINAHPDTRKYKLDYKNQKEELCKELYKLYNENVFDNKLPKDMSIEWNVRMRGTAGFCYNKKSVRSISGIIRTSRIVLATKIVDTADRLRDTLIHEMCHAAAWLINGVGDGHGPFWTAWATKAMRTFPELPPIRRCHDYEIRTKFTYKCTSCGYSIGRHSKSLNIEKKRCGYCYGKFELLVNKTTKSGTVQVQTPKREPSAFALYVKQNYSAVKKGTNNVRHADVMKLLGQQFAAIKLTKETDLAVEK